MGPSPKDQQTWSPVGATESKKVVNGAPTSQTQAKERKPETPKRKALKEAIAAKLENLKIVRKSPRLTEQRLTPGSGKSTRARSGSGAAGTAKRLGTNQASPRFNTRTHSDISKSLAKASAALGPRTPEVMKRYKSRVAEGANRHVVEVGARLTQHTNSSQMKVQPGIKQGLTVKPVASTRPTLTMPKEFNFATSQKTAVR